MDQDKAAQFLEIAFSDLCLEERLAQHFALHFGHDVPFLFVELGFTYIWAHDTNAPQLDSPYYIDGVEYTIRGQIEEFHLEPYLNRALVPVRPECAEGEWILTCDASLDQKLKWHLKRFDKPISMNAVVPAKQAIWLDSYGFDWDTTMIPLPDDMRFRGAREASLRNFIGGHALDDFLIDTEDNGRLDVGSGALVGSSGADGGAHRDGVIWDNQ